MIATHTLEYDAADWNMDKAARALGIGKTKAYDYLRRTTDRLDKMAVVDPDSVHAFAMCLAARAYAAKQTGGSNGSAASVLAALERMGIHVDPGQLPLC